MGGATWQKNKDYGGMKPRHRPVYINGRFHTVLKQADLNILGAFIKEICRRNLMPDFMYRCANTPTRVKLS